MNGRQLAMPFDARCGETEAPRHSLAAMCEELRGRCAELRRYIAWVAPELPDDAAAGVQALLRAAADELDEALQAVASHTGPLPGGQPDLVGRLVSVSVHGRKGFAVAAPKGRTAWFSTADTGVLADARDMLGRSVAVCRSPVRITVLTEDRP